MKTLIYPGAKRDSDFLIKLPGYQQYLLFDTLPHSPRHVEHDAEPSFERFLAHLCKEYGKYTKHDASMKTIWFPRNVMYHYECDYTTDAFIRSLPPGDILLRGGVDMAKFNELFEAEQARGVERKLFVGCGTPILVSLVNWLAEIVHFSKPEINHGECFCKHFGIKTPVFDQPPACGEQNELQEYDDE